MKVFLSTSLLVIGLLALPVKAIAQNTDSQADRVCMDTDCSKELRRLIRLARGGSGDAAAFVAMAYATGDGLEQNTEQAIRYLRMGVRQRNPMAVNLMSDWLRNGFMVEQDLTEAARLLEQAVKLNYAPAQYNKALQLLQSEDPEQLPEAVNLLEQATSQKLSSAMLLLAQLKQHGVGVEQDLPGAAELYKRLVLSGQHNAKPYLHEVTSQLAADSEHSALVAELREVENIEIIRVSGQQFQTSNMLEGLVKRLSATGQFDTRSVGSRIRGVSCEQSGSNCASIRPERGASSLNEVLSGGQ
ncbi:hypothetical protein GCM10010919_07040 [Alishewanella longhuensis]|uniref:Sel1 repeat family protein n=1 Tax=Alishewanella longhuensis TaxID=1091037 RepID=A0ABQ3KUZ8_9ALTE|nr:tetratricopeptide repeat protein [Alishewanella longhuensis]GHG62052.1 hypothetical protein GCM10010919_07040 [Alishewanella longhuensis]